MSDSAILGVNGKPFHVSVKEDDGKDTFAPEGSMEANELHGFTRKFINSLREAVSRSQGMTLVGTHFWYFPNAKVFSQLTSTDLDNYYRKAYTEKEREAHRREIAIIRKQARELKSQAMKGSDAIVPHMYIPFLVGNALEKQFPDDFSSTERRPRAMAVLEGLMPDWVLVPQFTRRSA